MNYLKLKRFRQKLVDIELIKTEPIKIGSNEIEPIKIGSKKIEPIKISSTKIEPIKIQLIKHLEAERIQSIETGIS